MLHGFVNKAEGKILQNNSRHGLWPYSTGDSLSLRHKDVLNGKNAGVLLPRPDIPQNSRSTDLIRFKIMPRGVKIIYCYTTEPFIAGLKQSVGLEVTALSEKKYLPGVFN